MLDRGLPEVQALGMRVIYDPSLDSAAHLPHALTSIKRQVERFLRARVLLIRVRLLPNCEEPQGGHNGESGRADDHKRCCQTRYLRTTTCPLEQSFRRPDRPGMDRFSR